MQTLFKECFAYTLFQNGGHQLYLKRVLKSTLLFSLQINPCRLKLIRKLEIQRIFSLHGATRANLQVNKSILKWRPFWNKMYRILQ